MRDDVCSDTTDSRRRDRDARQPRGRQGAQPDIPSSLRLRADQAMEERLRRVKTIAVVMVATLLISVTAPRRADALNAETSFFIAWVGAAVIVAIVQAMAAQRPQRSRSDAAVSLLVSADPDDDVAVSGATNPIAEVTVGPQSP